MSRMTLDAVIARLQNMSPVNLWEVLPSGETRPWYEISGQIVNELVVHEDNLLEQAQLLAAQIMYWGRLQSQAKRVWEIEERLYRIWRDTTSLKFAQLKEREGSKLTKEQIEQQVRAVPGYRNWQERLERAEECYNAVGAVLEGWRAKKDVMRSIVIRRTEDAAPTLSI